MSFTLCQTWSWRDLVLVAISLDIQDGGSSEVFPAIVQKGFRVVRKSDRFILQELLTNRWDKKCNIFLERAWRDEFVFKTKQQERSIEELCAMHVEDSAIASHQEYFRKNIELQLWGKNLSEAVYNNVLYHRHPDNTRDKILLKSGRDMIDTIVKHFPMLSGSLVEAGVKKWCDYNKFPMIQPCNL